MTTENPSSTALAELRGEVMTALVELKGDLRLLIAQNEHSARQAANLERMHESLDGRVDGLEATRVAREELDRVRAEMKVELEKVRADARAEVQQVRADLTEKGRRNIAAAGLVIPAASGALSWYASATGKG